MDATQALDYLKQLLVSIQTTNQRLMNTIQLNLDTQIDNVLAQINTIQSFHGNDVIPVDLPDANNNGGPDLPLLEALQLQAVTRRSQHARQMYEGAIPSSRIKSEEKPLQIESENTAEAKPLPQFNCKHCNRPYYSKSGMGKHIRKVHREK